MVRIVTRTVLRSPKYLRSQKTAMCSSKNLDEPQWRERLVVINFRASLMHLPHMDWTSEPSKRTSCKSWLTSNPVAPNRAERSTLDAWGRFECAEKRNSFKTHMVPECFHVNWKGVVFSLLFPIVKSARSSYRNASFVMTLSLNLLYFVRFRLDFTCQLAFYYSLSDAV